MKKIRIQLLDLAKGQILRHIPVSIKATIKKIEQDSDFPNGREVIVKHNLGLLASNHVGYLSLPIPNEIFGLGEVMGYEAALVSGMIDQIIQINPNQLDIVHHISINRNGFELPTLNPSLPSIPQPDLLDWKLCPDSFGSSNIPIIGEDGCETLLPSSVTERVFTFSQLIKTPDISTSTFVTRGTGGVRGITVKKGRLLNYEMSWNPINHGLGQVLYSLTLAPCESVNLAIIDWSREDLVDRTEATGISETILHDQRRDRIIDEAVEAMVEEFQKGKSLLGGTAGVGGYGQGSWGVTGSHAIGIGKSQSEGERSSSASTVQNLSDRIVQASNALREVRSTVIVRSNQTERERIETRAVRNNNHSHALTILYYEVVRHYCVSTKLATTQDVFFIDYSSEFITNFTIEDIIDNILVLESNLIDIRLTESFKAAERLKYNFNDLPDSPPEATELAISSLSIDIGTGNNGTNRDVYFRIQKVDGTVVEKEVDPPGNSFERNTITSIVFQAEGDLADLTKEDIQRVGIRYNTRLADWTYSSLVVQYSSLDGSEFGLLYDSRDDSESSLSLPHRFTRDGEWWSSRIQHDLNMDVINEYNRRVQEREEELLRVQKLIDHLNSNAHYYNKAIWIFEDKDARATRLDQFYEDESGLLDSIDNYIIGISGNYVAFPAGDLKVHVPNENDPIYPIERIISIPTRGSFAESKLSHCNASEKIDETRFWKWHEAPCGLDAPIISNIQPSSRFQSPSGITPSTPSSTIGIQGTPEAPSPTGLNDILELLKTPDIFRDMSGMDELGPLLEKLAEVAGEVEQRRLQEQGETEREKIKAESKEKETENDSASGSNNSNNRTAPSSTGSNNQSTNSRNSAGTNSSNLSAREQLGDSQVFRDILNNGVEEGWISEEFAGEQYRQYAQNIVGEGESTTRLSDVGSFNAGNIYHQRILFSNFPVNSDELTIEHRTGLDNILALFARTEDFYVQLIEGRASNTGPENETPSSIGNVELSRARANRVAQYLVEGLEDFNISDPAARVRQVTWYGSSRSITQASGEIDLNRSVSVLFSYQITPPVPEQEVAPIDERTTHWAIYLEFSVAVHFVIGGWYAAGYLKNRDTGEVFNIDMLVMGVGEGLATPGSSGRPSDDDYVEFETLRPVTAQSFNKQYIRAHNLSGGIILGGGYTGLVIPDLVGPDLIQVYGGTLGTIGADASVGLGGVLWVEIP